MTQPVQDIDHGWKRIKRDMKAMARHPLVVDVGITGSEAIEQHANTDLTNAAVGAFQEYGTPSIDERSFLRATVDAKHNDIARMFIHVAKGVTGGKVDQKRGLGLAGERVVSWIKARIRAGIPPALSAKTIAARKRQFGKASTKPLIATGQLMGSITYAVRGANEGAK